jgi:hypothetical protein
MMTDTSNTAADTAAKDSAEGPIVADDQALLAAYQDEASKIRADRALLTRTVRGAAKSDVLSATRKRIRALAKAATTSPADANKPGLVS